MPQNEPPPGFLARLTRAFALAIVSLGVCVGYALWNARATVAEQGYKELGFARSEFLEYLAGAWSGWARGLEIAPRVGLAALLVLLVLQVFPRLRPTSENLHEAVRGTGRAFLAFTAGLILMGELALHLLERQWTRDSAWLGPGDVVAASAAFVVAYLGITLAGRRARRGAMALDTTAILAGTGLLAFGGYWLNRGLWAPPQETDILLRNVLLFAAAVLVSALGRQPFLRALPRLLWRPLVVISLIVALSPALLRGRLESRGTPTITVANPMNVVVIALDTVRADYTSLVPEPRRGSLRTPVLRALADRGVNFHDAIAQAPWTLPSFASVLTGKYPHQHGAFTLDAKLRASELTLPEVLREAGYQTLGVVSHLYLESYRGLAQGYEFYDESQALGHEAITSIQVTDRALRLLERADPEQPFFLFAHYFDPHWEYQDHQGWTYGDGYEGWLTEQLDLDNLHKNRHLLEEADLAYLSGLYQEEISYSDRHIGRLIAHLEATGLVDNTLIVVVSDHGEEFMEHGGLDHTTTVFQELVHVPLLIVPPRGTAESMEVAGTVETRRVFGTVLDLLGVDAPLVADARAQTLLTRVENGFEAHPAPAYTSVWLEESDPRWGKRFKIAALVDGPWKFVNDLTLGREMLFDLQEDPGEQRDIHGRKADRTRLMRTRLHAWIKAMQEAAVGLETADASAEQLAKLRALGYAGNEENDQ